MEKNQSKWYQEPTYKVFVIGVLVTVVAMNIGSWFVDHEIREFGGIILGAIVLVGGSIGQYISWKKKNPKS